MRFFPFRRWREKSDAFLDRLRAENAARGCGFAALEEKATGETLGFAGLYPDATAVMRRIGMLAEQASDFAHPRVPDSHPHLKRHLVYRLTRDEWKAIP